MGRYPGTVDRTNFVTLEPKITRAYWGQPRAWNGHKVEVVVETRWVPDGTPLEITVLGPGDVTIEKLPPQKVQRGRCAFEHEIHWKHDHVKVLGEDAIEPDFYFIASIPRFELERRSNELYVDLTDYVVSG